MIGSSPPQPVPGQRHRLRSALLILLAVIPGLSSILRGRTGLGIALFLLFTLSLNAAFLLAEVYAVPGSTWMVFGSLALAVLAIILSLADNIMAALEDPIERDKKRRDLLLQGFAAYVRGDFEDALGMFTAHLALDRRDPAAWLHLGAIHRHLGQGRKAAQFLRRARKIDREGIWHLEVDRELEQLRGTVHPFLLPKSGAQDG